jgi:hypothetical protein
MSNPELLVDAHRTIDHITGRMEGRIAVLLHPPSVDSLARINPLVHERRQTS